MKKLTLLSVFAMYSLTIYAQGPVSSLNENFDVACATASFPNNSWTVYNPLPSTIPMGEWQCTATNGRPNSLGSATPGMQCTGVWSSSYHLDTSYFVTPLLQFDSPLPDSIYLQFDSKTTDFVLGGGRLAVIKSSDSITTAADSDLTHYIGVNPLISNGDSSGWVTHQINLTSYGFAPPFYLAFRYVSPSTSGNTWYLDNISLTTIRLSVPHLNKEVLPLTVIGNSTTSQVILSYTAPEAAKYNIVMYDMVGRKVCDRQIMAQDGTATYTINDLNLHPGMYCVKMGNENTYGTVKVVIQ